MAHEIEFLNGKATMAYVGEKPWHGLGFRVSSDISPEEMMKAAHLDWNVNKVPLFYESNGEQMSAGRDALIRDIDGKLLDVVPDNWKPVQNIEAFQFFSDWVDAGDMTMETAGSLKDGKIVWALAKIKNDTFEVVKGDVVESYLLFSNPHMYGKSLEVRSTNIRVVCNNTMTLALSKKANYHFRMNHSTVFDSESIKETLGSSHQTMIMYKEKSEFIASKRYNPAQMTDYINKMFPTTGQKNEMSRSARIIKDLVDTQPGADMAPGTFWNLFNAVTYATDHVLGRSVDSRLSSAWFGPNQVKKIDALNLALDMAMAS